MVGIVVAVVTGLVALIPAFATSERRRVLKYLQDETKLVDETEDRALQEAHRETALVTAQRYRDLAGLTKVDRLQAQTQVWFAPFYISLVIGGALMFFPESISEDEQTVQYLNALGNGLAVLCASAALIQGARLTSARREARKTAERNSALTRRAEVAEAKVEDAEAKVKKVRTNLRQLRRQEEEAGSRLTMGDVSRLLDELDLEIEDGQTLVTAQERAAAQAEKQRQADHERQMAARRAAVEQRKREVLGQQRPPEARG